MDEQVLAAMARWPDVPAVYGWLRLDRRGGWHLIDRGRPGFDPTGDAAGSPITSPPIVDFIGRNYSRDDAGRWFWQNGPQRVFVDLDLAPLILRVLEGDGRSRLVTHTGHLIGQASRCRLDEAGNLIVDTDHGIAAVHDLDLAQLRIEQTSASNEASATAFVRLAGTLLPIEPWRGPIPGFVRRPGPAPGEAASTV